MDNREFSMIRRYLGETQNKLSRLLCISKKAVESYEQGWRKIPINVEKQMLYLLAVKRVRDKKIKPCWDIKKCPIELREHCPAWELKSGYFCWFISGASCCEGYKRKNWNEKIKVCKKCKVFHYIMDIHRMKSP